MLKISLANPVLAREMRASLRNARAFALMALYVALLGAFVASNFPGDQALDLKSDGGAKGQQLFNALFQGQIALILLIIPALATGALAQERERQTLTPLLLTPLSPLQIVWGKAGGVLSIIGLLLLATLPLTSLCFLLGGVEPGRLLAAYAAIFGLAAFTTGFCLYCAARWSGATRSMLMCYVLLPGALLLVVGLSPFGMIICGFFVLSALFYALVQGWKRGERSRMAKFFGEAYGPLIYLIAPVLAIALLAWIIFDRNVGLLAFAFAFCLSYFLLVAHWGMLETARELMNRADAEPNMRQKVEDLKSDWSAATTLAPATAPSFAAGSMQKTGEEVGEWKPILPGQLSTGEAQPLHALSHTSDVRAAPVRREKTATYGKIPFLSDRMNPIYARELRSGLLGKWEILFRYSWIVAIGSEVFLLGVLLLGLFDPRYLAQDFEAPFRFWGAIHLAFTMLFGCWFGARAIAPEREGQTLEQLLMIPLRPQKIIGGKMAAVCTFTLYIWVLALPMAILMGMLGLVAWQTALWFPFAEAILGILSAAWGIFCSFHSPNVRRAIGLALGGVATVLVAGSFVGPLFELLKNTGFVSNARFSARFVENLLPFRLAFPLTNASTNYGMAAQNQIFPTSTFIILAIYAVLAAVLFALTARNFQKMARNSS